MTWEETHLPCPKCDSSDAYSVSRNDAGELWGKCFSCDANVPVETHESRGSMQHSRVVSIKQHSPGTEHYSASEGVIYREIPSRKLNITTLEKYGVGFRGKDLIFPYGNETAAKVRINGDKNFRTEGNWNDTPYLFGQERFNAGGYRVLVVEGEFDALAAFQMLGSKYPVVSVRTGAQSALKDCKNNYEWLDSFDDIIFCFDNDPAGQEAQTKCAELFVHKSKVMTPVNGVKDACDFIKGRQKEFSDGFWASQKWTPQGIVAGSSMYNDVMKPLAVADCMYPYAGLNKMTYGLRHGEMVTITAGSGLGKSQFVRELVWHILQNTESKIGLMFLEESTRKTGLSMMSLAADKPLHLPDCTATQEEKDNAFNQTLGTDRLFLFDHFGSSDIDNIISRVRYLAKAVGCDYIFLDHISIVVSAQSNGDERKAIDEIMTKLRTMVQETGIALICVSHLKRPDSKGHEEGAATSLSQLRGSASIAQLSDMVIGLERNGQAEDATERNTTKVRVLKNRFCGTTGPSCDLLYSLHTGRMVETDGEEAFEDDAL